jgi:hypothetical protein
MSTALKSWASALHPDSEWSADLKVAAGGGAKPMVTFAPALLLRKRTQTGMVRIYEAMIARLSGDKEEAPPGWTGLVEDADDQDVPGSAAPFTEGATKPSLDRHEVYFPLPANREQRRIVEAISRRRGVLVQGPPGTGKRLQLLARLTLNPGKHAGNEPARVAQLDDGNDRAILV